MRSVVLISVCSHSLLQVDQLSWWRGAAPQLVCVVVELTEQARMPSTNHLTTQPLTRSALHAAHRCARAAPRNDSGESAAAFRPWGHPTHEVSEQTSRRASLSHGEASCVQPNVSIWLRQSRMVHARAAQPCLLFNLASTRTRRLRRYSASARTFSLHHHSRPIASLTIQHSDTLCPPPSARAWTHKREPLML